MTTLESKPVAAVLQRLLGLPNASSQSVRPSPRRSRARHEDDDPVRSKTGYLDFYRPMKDMPLAVSRETGALLYMLARSSRAKTIVEFGASFGISTIFLASALRDNGGGRLITTEFEPSKIARARKHLTEAGLIELVEIREGDALLTLKSGLPETIDLVLLDGAKGIYLEVLSLLEARLPSGARVVADNTNYCPDYEARVREPANGYLSIPFGDDVEVSMRTSSTSASGPRDEPRWASSRSMSSNDETMKGIRDE